MKLLLLGGTMEARHLAARLVALDYDVTVSLAGLTRTPQEYKAPTRTGGFGGIEGLSNWLTGNGIGAVIDATHPFADQMPWHAFQATQALDVPRLRLCRPPWPLSADWHAHETLASAVAALPSGGRILATTGQDQLQPYMDRTDLAVWLRTIEDPGPLPGHISLVQARPPFTIEEERDLLANHGITHLTTKNSGGDRSKLDAAEAVSVAIHVIARPAPPPGPSAESLEEAVAWLAQTVASNP
ncbi:MAG: precorrin-6A/cobalt-precorrin-6A reductase [Pseudomonadota bacterium]